MLVLVEAAENIKIVVVEKLYNTLKDRFMP